MKKKLFFILFISYFIFPSPYATSISHPADPVVLNLWFQDSSKQMEFYLNQAISRFSNQYPHLKINLKLLKGDDLKTTHYISTSLLNQDTPDLFATSLNVYNQLATEHFLYSLDDFVASYPPNHFLSTAIENGIYQDTLYGIAYSLNPEVFVYRKDFLDSLSLPYPENICTIQDLESYAKTINNIYSKDRLDKVTFAIPTLTSNGNFISSLLHTTSSSTSPATLFETLSNMYYSFDISPYHYSKVETHPFFSGKAALAIEPLSLLYAAIERDNSLQKKIGIMPLPETGIQFAYSRHKYLSICTNTTFPEESLLFMSFFFSPQEVLERYKTLNLPIMLESLMPDFITEANANNQFIADYIRTSFHFPISPTLAQTLHQLDSYYDVQIHTAR